MTRFDMPRLNGWLGEHIYRAPKDQFASNCHGPNFDELYSLDLIQLNLLAWKQLVNAK
jgi:hypothetical protein